MGDRPDVECVVCIQGGGRTSGTSNGCGWNKDVSFTLNEVDVHAVAYNLKASQVTLTEKRFFEWHEDDKSVTLRSKSGSYGGGSEVLIVHLLD